MTPVPFKSTYGEFAWLGACWKVALNHVSPDVAESFRASPIIQRLRMSLEDNMKAIIMYTDIHRIMSLFKYVNRCRYLSKNVISPIGSQHRDADEGHEESNNRRS